MREYGRDQSRPKVSYGFAVLTGVFFLLVDAMKGLKMVLAAHTKLREMFPVEGARSFLEQIHTSCTYHVNCVP